MQSAKSNNNPLNHGFTHKIRNKKNKQKTLHQKRINVHIVVRVRKNQSEPIYSARNVFFFFFCFGFNLPHCRMCVIFAFDTDVFRPYFISSQHFICDFNVRKKNIYNCEVSCNISCLITEKIDIQNRTQHKFCDNLCKNLSQKR